MFIGDLKPVLRLEDGTAFVMVEGRPVESEETCRLPGLAKAWPEIEGKLIVDAYALASVSQRFFKMLLGVQDARHENGKLNPEQRLRVVLPSRLYEDAVSAFVDFNGGVNDGHLLLFHHREDARLWKPEK